VRQLLILVALLLGSVHEPEILRFAVIGDNGTGERPQYEVGQQMAAAHAAFPFEFVLMLGDNMYGRQEPQDFVLKFEKPYAALLEAGVPFYAALGNHDRQTNRAYRHFNMNGQRYYTFTKKHVRFYVFDSNIMDDAQVEWIRRTLPEPFDGWKVCVFHHPIYSDGGRHGSNVELRVLLEPIMLRAGIDVAFSGHEHIYERLVPQKGITYFIAGTGGQLRKGDLVRSPMTAAGFDQDRAFMVIEVVGDELRFRTISRLGQEVDAGVVRRRPRT
jgi:hypothetical protein